MPMPGRSFALFLGADVRLRMLIFRLSKNGVLCSAPGPTFASSYSSLRRLLFTPALSMLRARAGRSGHGTRRRAGHRLGVDTCVPCQPRERGGAPEAVLSDHYEAVSKQYHAAFFYTGDYERWQRDSILSHLELHPFHRLVDIGGGTGRFASLLHAAAGLENAVLVVDPSRKMLEEAATLPGVDTVCQGGLEFAQTASMTSGYDRALIKEVVHHLDDEDLVAMYSGIFAQLPPGGRVLTCTRPHTPSYPFFRGALEVCHASSRPWNIMSRFCARPASLRCTARLLGTPPRSTRTGGSKWCAIDSGQPSPERTSATHSWRQELRRYGPSTRGATLSASQSKWCLSPPARTVKGSAAPRPYGQISRNKKDANIPPYVVRINIHYLVYCLVPIVFAI